MEERKILGFLEWYEDFLDVIYSHPIDLSRHGNIKQTAEKDYFNNLTPKQSADCFYIDNYLP